MKKTWLQMEITAIKYYLVYLHASRLTCSCSSKAWLAEIIDYEKLLDHKKGQRKR